MLKKIAFGTLCSVASVAFAQEGTMETTSTGMSPIKVFANVDLNITTIDGGAESTDTGMNFGVGVDGVYMFTENMGAGIGLDFNMLNGEKDVTGGTFSLENNYLDVPVSFAYNLDATPSLGFMFLAGPYIGIPMGDWKFEDTTPVTGGKADIDAKMAIGLNLETHATWNLAQDFALGGHLGFKYAFNDLADEGTTLGGTNEDQKYWMVGVGISAKFL